MIVIVYHPHNDTAVCKYSLAYIDIFGAYTPPHYIDILIYSLRNRDGFKGTTRADQNIDSAPAEPPARPREIAIVPQHPALAFPIPRLAPQNPRFFVVRHREALPSLQPGNPQTNGMSRFDITVS